MSSRVNRHGRLQIIIVVPSAEAILSSLPSFDSNRVESVTDPLQVPPSSPFSELFLEELRQTNVRRQPRQLSSSSFMQPLQTALAQLLQNFAEGDARPQLLHITWPGHPEPKFWQRRQYDLPSAIQILQTALGQPRRWHIPPSPIQTLQTKLAQPWQKFEQAYLAPQLPHFSCDQWVD